MAVVNHAKESDDSFNFQSPVFLAAFFLAGFFVAGIFLAMLTVRERLVMRNQTAEHRIKFEAIFRVRNSAQILCLEFRMFPQGAPPHENPVLW